MTKKINNNILANSQVNSQVNKAIEVPNRQQIRSFAEELNSNVDPDKFFDYYDKRLWKIGGEPINDWKAVFRSWDAKELSKPSEMTKKSRIGKHVTIQDDPEFLAYVKWFAENADEKWWNSGK